ncbi:hypothetical protein SETIT_4G067200v2 [Setaria italica]|uniref:WRKY domain-containing protein n=1 Tax=Setaria italica TaxID=4555 RepID=K3Y3M5_SETIT|nr:uncharacterized protein LOC101764723 [Setaria italica]XP_022681387.1 uncharacterized protein LOC101764723 [Setaria italica]RCV20572.1 hypothetical protein SETIT_4G067200v2 [Setaria italica]
MQDGAGGEGGIQLLLTILADGEEQARQLGELADDPRSRAEHYRGAARRLQCTLGKAVAVAKAVEAASGGSSRGTDRSDSPRSVDESSGATAAVEPQERQVIGNKRRKGLPRWTAKFRVPDANLEATPDDGFSWRKYGQKDILGAKFPRGYYRCTYRTAQGCPATKQVQRSDADLCVFDVTYQGEHTCHQKQRHVAVATAHGGGGGSQSPPPSCHEQGDPSMQLLMGFKDALKVETGPGALHQDRDYYDHGPASAPAAPFSFPSVPFGEAAAAAAAFSAPGSSYFPAPPHHCPAVAGSYDVYDYEAGPGPRVRGGAEPSELGEVVSRATGCDYSSLYHHAGLDPHLPFAPFGGPSHGPFQ